MEANGLKLILESLSDQQKETRADIGRIHSKLDALKSDMVTKDDCSKVRGDCEKSRKTDKALLRDLIKLTAVVLLALGAGGVGPEIIGRLFAP